MLPGRQSILRHTQPSRNLSCVIREDEKWEPVARAARARIMAIVPLPVICHMCTVHRHFGFQLGCLSEMMNTKKPANNKINHNVARKGTHGYLLTRGTPVDTRLLPA